MSKTKLGICLSGGSLKGIAGHTGFIKRIMEIGDNFEITDIVGTSAGSVVASLIASGVTPSELEDIVVNLKLSDFAESSYVIRSLWRWFGPQKFMGAIRAKNLESFLRDKLKVQNFESCKIKCNVVATNLSRGCPTVFNSGLIVPAVRASLSIPFVFEAKEINGEWYEDGGMVSNAAVGVLADANCDIVIVNNFFRPRTEPDNSFMSGPEFMRQSVIMNRRFEAVQAIQELANQKVIEDTGKTVFQFRPQIPTNVNLLKPDAEAISKTIVYGYLETDRLIKELKIEEL